jgi:hypothetical protein
MSSLRSDLREYLRAFIDHWLAVILGTVASVALGIIPALLGLEVPPWFWGVVLAFAIVPASFLAWRSEHRKVEQAAGRTRRRSITDRSAMIERLMALPKGDLELTCLGHDSESREFSSDLKQVLTAGGWEVTEIYQLILDDGLWIRVKDPSDPPSRATALKAILEKDGIAVTLAGRDPQRHSPAAINGHVQLEVGSNPN